LLIKIKDNEGNDRGDCTGDYCDVEEMVFENISLQKGNYKVRIINEFNSDYLPNVLGLGIRILYADAKKQQNPLL
jgi:hypothetical protein